MSGKLTRKRRAWIEEYLTCWNATEAARRVGYKHPNAQGPRLLLDVSIQEIIEKRIAEKAMSADEVLLRLAEQARGDISEFVKAGGGIDWEKVGEKGRLVKSIAHTTGKNSRLELYDAQAALVHLGKHHGLFKDRIEHSGPEGSPIVATNTIIVREYVKENEGD